MVLANYGDNLWHERLLLARISGGKWIIMTADGDVYAEDYGSDGVDVESVRVLRPDGGRPAGLSRARIYGWAAGMRPSGDILRDALVEGRALADLERGGASDGGTGSGPPLLPEVIVDLDAGPENFKYPSF